MSKSKHTCMQNEDDDEGDEGYVNDMHCSNYHFDEILQQRPSQQKQEQLKQHKNQNCQDKPSLPKPVDLTEYLIYYANRLLAYTNKKKIRPSGYWRYVLNVYKNLFLAFYFNWVVIFTSPLSSLAFVFTYPIISVLLFIFEIGLKLFMDGLGGAELVKRISDDFGDGFSIINWGAPQLLLSEKSIDVVSSTLHALSSDEKEKEREDDEKDDDHRHRTFDISIAESMTILSSLVYERHDEDVTKAYKLLNDFHAKKIKDKTLEQIEKEMKRLIWKSEKPIRKIARRYGLRFAGVTELKSLGGPFCGLFWAEDPVKNPLIIVVFKGTTPTNYSEFLVDATLQRTDARSYLFGAAHQGFYDSLFPTHYDDDDSRDPYFAIQSAVKQKAKQIQQAMGNNKKPVQVWVTGHSLGAAMSALLFARWLKCPEDIAPYCQVRDAYVIGLPAVGDNDFASVFASYSNTPLSRTSTLWRIINKSDVICRIPPGYNNMTIGHYVPQTDFFNYSHVGHAVQITHAMLNPDPLKIYPSSYQSNVKVNVVVSSDSDTLLPQQKRQPSPDVAIGEYPWWIRPWIKRAGNPILIIESFYPFFLRDHIPIHYFEGLERARFYYNKKNMCSSD